MILRTGLRSASENMELDRKLLAEVGSYKVPLLHLYRFPEKSATYGHFADPNKLLLPNATLDLGKRPTGGGLIFHTHDLAFSLLIPSHHPLFGSSPLESYRNVHGLLIEALTPLLPPHSLPLSLLPEEPASPPLPYCMARPTRYDLLQGGKKVGGAAQRRTKEGLLHQGSLFLHMPPIDFLASLVPSQILTSIAAESRALFPESSSLEELRETVEHSISQALQK